MNKDYYKGKIVVVTGASGRFGKRVVQAFAERGAIVAALVRDENAARDIPFPEDAEGWAFPADVTDDRIMRACFARIGEQFGRVDLLVHTVGGWQAEALLDTSITDWEQMIKMNLTSAFLAFRESARLMQEEGGKLIALASGQGADHGPARQAAYAASKAGVIRLVEATAAEYADKGIKAYAIAPSTILYGDDSGQRGVAARDLVELCLYLGTPSGDVLNGSTIRAYGTQQ